MALAGLLRIAAGAGLLPVDLAEGLKRLLRIGLDRQQVVRAVRVDQRPGDIPDGVQGIEGDHATSQGHLLEQGPHGGDLAVLVVQAEAGQG